VSFDGLLFSLFRGGGGLVVLSVLVSVEMTPNGVCQDHMINIDTVHAICREARNKLAVWSNLLYLYSAALQISALWLVEFKSAEICDTMVSIYHHVIETIGSSYHGIVNR
jgi:hypothetical protein